VGIRIEELQALNSERTIPMTRVAAADPVQWAAEHAASVDGILETHGALLIRGIQVNGSKKLDSVLSSIFGGALIEYEHPSTPRTKLRGNIYTSTEYHPAQSIPLHNENSYSNKWPLRIGFYCVTASAEGGATPIADSRLVYERIPRDIVESFTRRQLMYVRNYSDIDLSWIDVFRTEDRGEVEKYCERNGIDFAWHGDNELRTRQISAAHRLHPGSGVPVWFNQAHLFHISSLSMDDQTALTRVFGQEELPRNVYYGDGGTIPDEALDAIRQVYDDCRIVFDWMEGDLLVLDNMLFCHGREPFSGDRKILVGMAKPCKG
jgi:alpha-ketoglutarate-dependent taurine dioxygenase